MTGLSHPSPAPQPIVLVGGRSQRFGRDKLREPWAGSEGGPWLVDQSRRALERACAGSRRGSVAPSIGEGVSPTVWAVGQCDPEVAGRFARHLLDGTSEGLSGAGPIAGIVAALRAASGPVVVLSGDLPMITAEAVAALLAAAERHPDADAVVATESDAAGERGPQAEIRAPFGPSIRLEPCVGVYRPSALRVFGSVPLDGKTPPLHRLLGELTTVAVPIDAILLRNVNRRDELLPHAPDAPKA